MRWFCGFFLRSPLFPFILFLTSSYVQLSLLHNLHDSPSLSCLFLDITTPCCSSNEFLASVGFLSMLMSLSHGQKQVM